MRRAKPDKKTIFSRSTNCAGRGTEEFKIRSPNRSAGGKESDADECFTGSLTYPALVGHDIARSIHDTQL